MISSATSLSARPTTAASSRLAAGIGALLFGAMIFLATGFAAPSLIHNATHDTRHALGLPCH